jgi:hypothetical protein
LNDFKTTINSGDSEAIKQIFSDFVITAYNQIEQKKKELKGLNESMIENTKSKTEMENIYKKIEELKKKKLTPNSLYK